MLEAIAFLSYLSTAIVLAIGVLSVFLYLQTRKRGFVLIGADFLSSVFVEFGFIITRVLWAAFGLERSFELSLTFSLIESVFLAGSMIVVLVGVVFLRGEFRFKPTP